MVLEINREIAEGQQSLPPSKSQVASGPNEALKKLGGILYHQLLPEKARAHLQSFNKANLSLRLDDRLIHVPWELCFDGQEFLGLKYFVGKQIITEYRSKSITNRGSFCGEEIKVLLIADPTETLESASREVEQLATYLDECTGFQVFILGGRQVTKTALLKSLGEFDIIHYAGHADFIPEEPGRSGWILHDSKMTSVEISKLDKVPSLIFSNSCQGGVFSPWEETRCVEKFSFGIGSSFLQAGVKNYIGTPWRLPDRASGDFASNFYRHLVNGCTLGETLLKTKKDSIKKSGWNDLLWANYSLYGDPAFRFPLQTKYKSKQINPSHQKRFSTLGITSLFFFLVISILGYLKYLDMESGRKAIDKPSEIKMEAQREVKTKTSINNFKKEILTEEEKSFLKAYETFKNGHINLAMKQFKDLSKEAKEPSLTYGLTGEAMIHFEAESIDKANFLLKTIFAKTSEISVAKLLHGDVLFSEGNLKNALKEYQNATKTGPNAIKAEALNAVGFSKWRAKDKKGALENFEKSLEIETDNRNGLLNLGYYYFFEGDDKKATDYFARVREIYLDDIVALYFLRRMKVDEEPKDFSGKHNILAVIPFPIVGGNPRNLGVAEAFSGILSESLSLNKIKTGSPNQVAQILHNETLPRLSSYETVNKLGKKLEVSFVVFGKIKIHQNLIKLDLNLLRTSDGTIFLSESLRVEKKPLLSNTVEKSASLISSALLHPVLE